MIDNLSARLAVACAGILLTLCPLGARAGDIVSGWSDVSTIQQIRSLSSETDFLLNASQAGCGTTDSGSWWKLTLDSTDKSHFKHAALLSAYLSAKHVMLRCESSAVSDFYVEN